jgi:hypothetical protein
MSTLFYKLRDMYEQDACPWTEATGCDGCPMQAFSHCDLVDKKAALLLVLQALSENPANALCGSDNEEGSIC